MANMAEVIKIDAKGRRLGRLASEIAVILRGKNDPNFMPNILPTVKVEIENVSKIDFTGDKMDQKIYFRYSGYPGGMRQKKLRNVFEKDPAWVLRRAIYKMLAPNRIRDKIIKNLTFK